jgi:hypothetical protein
MMIIESTAGTMPASSPGGTGSRAMWQWIKSNGSAAVKGNAPVNSSYKVTPSA